MCLLSNEPWDYDAKHAAAAAEHRAEAVATGDAQWSAYIGGLIWCLMMITC